MYIANSYSGVKRPLLAASKKRQPRGRDLAFGARLKEAMAARGESSVALAPRAGVHVVTLNHYREGFRPRPPTMAQLAAVLGVRREWLEAGSGQRDVTTAVHEPAGPLYGAAPPDRMRADILASVDAKAARGEPIRVTEVVGWLDRLYMAGKAEAERAATAATEAADVEFRVRLAEALEQTSAASQRPPRAPPAAEQG